MGSYQHPSDFADTRALVRQAMARPMLEAEHETELALAWRDKRDEKALHELTMAYLRLVVSIASKFKTYGLPVSDLVQEGCVGLMQAAARFDPERGVRFSTYANWWIKSSIQDYVLRNWSIVRTGTTSAQKSLFFKLRRLRALINEDSHDKLTPEGRQTIANKLAVPLKEVEKMESRLAANDRSLNAPMTADGDGEWLDLIADNRDLPEDEVMEDHDSAARSAWLGEALGHLSERELIIIRERRLQEDGVTLEALGRRLGISKERVRQIEQVALKKLKSALLAAVPDPRKAGLVGA